jgi:hypothetical protein
MNDLWTPTSALSKGIRRSGLALAVAASVLNWASVDAQSGRGSMSGYVVLRGASTDARTRAHVELVSTNPQEQLRYEADADERGLFKVPAVAVGEYRMRISSPGFKTYETTLYIPSDFLGNLAVILKPASDKSPGK